MTKSDRVKQFEEQAETCKKVRARIESAILFYVAEQGKISGPTNADDVLKLAQALDIACRCEHQALKETIL